MSLCSCAGHIRAQEKASQRRRIGQSVRALTRGVTRLRKPARFTFPGVVAGFFVGVAGVGSFAGAHKTVAGAVVGHRIVGFPRSLHRGDRCRELWRQRGRRRQGSKPYTGDLMCDIASVAGGKP